MRSKIRLAAIPAIAALILSSCGSVPSETPSPAPAAESSATAPVRPEEKEFVPHTYSGNAIVMPESSGGVTVSAELKPIDDAALNGCTAISNQADRYACEDEVRI